MSETRQTVCPHCSGTFTIPFMSRQKFCSVWCVLWSGVDRRGDDECWLWTKGADAHGYGSLGFMSTIYKSHRLALESRLGRSLPPEECALHDCDTPRCCNPKHLRVGTRSENIKECWAKGRGVLPPWFGKKAKGDRGLPSDVIDFIVDAVAVGETPKDVADRLGLSPRAVHGMLSRRRKLVAVAA